jgi:quercetin dioxygenase-like cupin family protein
MAYATMQLDELQEISDGRAAWRPVRHHLGIESFGVNTWTGHAAGDRIINEHDEEEDGNEELYLVLRGRAVFELDGERQDAPTGTLVFCPPNVKRTAFAEEPGTTLLALGGKVGSAYAPNGWDVWAPLQPLYAAGGYDKLADQARGVVEANPQYPMVAYNIACCESLAGRHADAIGHLASAVAGSEDLRTLARQDSDFDAIRDDPRFKELVGT